MEKIRAVLPSVIKSLEDPEKQKRSLLTESWRSIAGPKLGDFTVPRLSAKGVLYIYVKESVLAFEIQQKYRAAFLKRAQMVLGEQTVKEVKILVGKPR